MNVLKLNWLTEHYAEFVLNRPEMKNAVNFAMIDGFNDALAILERKDTLKGLLIRGEGHSFCSGGDLQDFHTLDAGEAVLEKMLKPMTAVLIRIKNLPCPVISFVEGAAVGGGAELAASTDRIYVTPEAKFGFIQVKLGIRTGWGGAGLIERHIDEESAGEMLRTGRIYSGDELKGFGFQVSHKPVSIDLFEGIEKLPPDPDLEERMYEEAEECAALWGSSIHGEKIKAFLEK